MAQRAKGRLKKAAAPPKSFPSCEDLAGLWARHHGAWREVSQVASQWREASEMDPRLLEYRVEGAWWETLAEAQITLLVTREYEHLVMALRADVKGPHLSYMQLPHPSGLVVDRLRDTVHIASTRNPNQVYDLAPVTGLADRGDLDSHPLQGKPLVPVRSRFLPGCLYMHDLAFIGADLYANAVGHNAVVRLHEDGRFERVWWPKCIETKNGPAFHLNYLQVNSIAAGEDLESSCFSASTDRMSTRRPGHRNFPVDGRGVIFSGKTREVCARGLTRPHSARWHGGRIWVDNSGYGEVGIADGAFTPVAQLPGWTRGLCFHDRTAFVGTSRVIPRFRQYAPGLNVDASLCGVHALDTRTGKVVGSLFWPSGNQIFAIDWVPSRLATGFPFSVGAKRPSVREKALFYAFATRSTQETN
jgi:uncharacterized protein (TIGR03032 family)